MVEDIKFNMQLTYEERFEKAVNALICVQGTEKTVDTCKSIIFQHGVNSVEQFIELLEDELLCIISEYVFQ